MLELEDFPDTQTLVRFAERFPELEVDALQTWLSLLGVADRLVSQLEDYLAGHGLSQRKFFTLILLSRNPDGLNISQLAEKTGVSCASITGVVERMRKAGLVTREPAPADRRIMVIRLTEAGEALLGQVLPGHYRQVARLMAPLDTPARHGLRELLARIDTGADPHQ